MANFFNSWWVFKLKPLIPHGPECSAMGIGQFPICKLKWDLLRTSVIACTIHKSTFSAQFRIFYVKMEIWYKIFQKNRIQPPYGVLPICKLLFPNGSYRNGVCRAFWAKTLCQEIPMIHVVLTIKYISKQFENTLISKVKEYDTIPKMNTYKEKIFDNYGIF